MYKYIFTGKLEPENLINSLSIKSTFGLGHPELKLEGSITLNVDRNNLEIIYISPINHTELNTPNLESVKNYIKESVELIINLYGFVHSLALDVYILKVKCSELGIDYWFGIKGENNIEKNQNEGNEEFKRLFSIFKTRENSPLKNIFSDFHKAIKYPAMTGQFCFRAVETIRSNYFDNRSDTNAKRRVKNGWNKLRKDLGYKKEDFEELEKYGIPNRHGEYPLITYQTREKLMNVVRNFINKFIEVKIDNPSNSQRV